MLANAFFFLLISSFLSETLHAVSNIASQKLNVNPPMGLKSTKQK